ncbi:MAG: carbon-nitrogen family hydrolase [Proteobacteria bacterium]|nr:carbon-nitrogen family hydrolase [Pseudomonadota bacterium]MBU1582642.1 carbon-nitrogen family hydrolase [Pseudomonadota bacterium]MBU2453850.1 carbon-nitrogen family hydrolase [Pseudomonadota bacterium]MBU2631328.1 carbon-nitrogen family hydrolase [Pseudomonadota bacterium]
MDKKIDDGKVKLYVENVLINDAVFITGNIVQGEKKIKVGVVQFDVRNGQNDANLTTALGYLAQLSAQNVCLAVLPEMFSCSFDNENLNKHSKLYQRIVERLSLFAGENQMAIAGTLPEKEKDQIYNTMVFIDVDGKVKGTYRKLHLFRLTNEHLYYGAGNKIVTVESSLGRIGLMTCYDLRFPELARSLFLKDAQMIVVSAQWPEKRIEHWKTLVKARALENQLFMVCSNRTGLDGPLQFPGMSMIVDPMGEIVADAGNADGTCYAEIDMTLVKTARSNIPCMTDRRQDIYG